MKKQKSIIVFITALLGLLMLSACSSNSEEALDCNQNVNEQTVQEQSKLQNEDIKNTKKQRVIYLTFDDGPSEYTQEILDILDKYDVKATFFVTADHESCLPLIKEEMDRGHSVGLHAYLHKNYLAKVYNSYLLAIERINQIVYEQTGKESNILRFPGGSSNTLAPEKMSNLIDTLTEHGFKYYDWDLDSNDSKDDATKETVLASMKNGVLESKNYSMILCHDVYRHTVEAVDEFIPWALENNFVFKPIDDAAPEVHHKLYSEVKENDISN